MEGIHIRYKFKMYRPVTFWTVLALVTLFLMSKFPAFVFPLIIEILILLQRPRRLFEHRLNEYFVVTKYPFSKWHGIFQSPERFICNPKTSNCKVFFRELSRQIIELFSLVDSGKGYYRITTHSVIKKRIEMLELQGKLKIICCTPAYEKDLAKLQDLLLHHKCRQCCDVESCRYRQASEGKRQFYYIEFYVR